MGGRCETKLWREEMTAEWLEFLVEIGLFWALLVALILFIPSLGRSLRIVETLRREWDDSRAPYDAGIL